MFAKYSLLAVALLSCRCLYAGACTPGSLLTYEGLPPGPTGGCTIGSSGIFLYNFTFNVPSSGGGATVLTAANFNINPTFTSNVFSLNISASGLSVTSGQSVQYVIGYTWDPFDDIQSMDDLEDPPSFSSPGSSSITSVGCLNQAFVGNSCGGSTSSVTVFDGPSTASLSGRTSFSPVTILGVQDTITLQGGSGGSASLDGFTNEVTIPEPATWLTCATFLVLL